MRRLNWARTDTTGAMPEKNLTSLPPAPPLPIQIADDPDQLERAGQFVLALIRKTATAAREAIGHETGATRPPVDRSETFEDPIDRDGSAERPAAPPGPPPTEAQRTEEAQDSYRKFVDAAALLRVANEEIVSLRKALDDKDRALSELKRDSLQMITFMRALLRMIDGTRSQASNDPPPNN